MAFVQNKFFNPTNFKPPTIRSNQLKKTESLNNSGFVSILLLFLTALMMTGMVGLFSLGVGIKNITRAQSQCIQANLQGQKELGLLLTQILKLNNTVLKLHRTRKTVEASLLTATGFGLAPLVSMLTKQLKFIMQGQKSVMARQKQLLAQSFLIKRKTFKNLNRKLKKWNIFHIQEQTFYKKALALQKQKEGNMAYTYKLVPDFTYHQKTRFTWKIKPFSHLDKNFQWIWPAEIKNPVSHTCTASLKQKGKQWISTLYH